MGSCLAVEVREPPALYYRRSGQPRPTLVRPKNKSAYRKYDDSSLYRPRFRTSFRGNNYRSPEDSRTLHTRDDEIQVIDGPVETIPRWPRTDRRRRAMVVPPQPRYYDDSDDDSWVGRRRGRRYSDDSWMEVNRPLRRRSSRRRSRSRNNSRYYL